MGLPKKHGNKWRVRWKDETGRRKSAVYNSFSEAEKNLILKKADVLKYSNEIPIFRTENKKCKELFQYYLCTYSVQKRNPQDDASIIRAHLAPFFNEIYLKDIHLCIEKFKISKNYLKPKTVCNILTLLTTMLNVAYEIQWIERVSKIRKPKVGFREKDFRYLRSGDEIRNFLTAASQVDETAYYLYAFACYTGARAGECAGLRWSDVNFERRIITVQRSYEELTKNYEIKHIPILNPLLPLLKEWRLKNPGDIVFPNKNGGMLRESNQIFQEVLKRVLVSARLPSYEGKCYITFHSLRHTFASHWMMNGGDIFKLQKILGHRDIKMTQRYSHMAPEAFSSEYGRISDFTGNNLGSVLNFPN